MTVIVGLVCKDAIVLASDSQTTDGYVKRCDTEKIFPVQFANCQALIAASGMSSMANHAIDIFQKMAGDLEIHSDDEIAQVARDALFEIRKSQSAIFPHEYTPEQWQRFYRDDNPAELTVGYWYDKTPYLWKVSLHECVPIKSRCGHITSGVGGSLGDYLLKENFLPNIETAAGVAIAAFVVDKVIENNATCGHPIRIAALNKPLEPQRLAKLENQIAGSKHARAFIPEFRNNVFSFSEDDVVKITKELHRIDAEMKSMRSDNIRKSLVIIASGMLKRLIEGSVTMKSSATGTLTDSQTPAGQP